MENLVASAASGGRGGCGSCSRASLPVCGDAIIANGRCIRIIAFYKKGVYTACLRHLVPLSHRTHAPSVLKNIDAFVEETLRDQAMRVSATATVHRFTIFLWYKLRIRNPELRSRATSPTLRLAAAQPGLCTSASPAHGSVVLPVSVSWHPTERIQLWRRRTRTGDPTGPDFNRYTFVKPTIHRTSHARLRLAQTGSTVLSIFHTLALAPCGVHSGPCCCMQP